MHIVLNHCLKSNKSSKNKKLITLFFVLQDCTRPLSIEADENGCYPLDGRILCMKCHTKRAKQAAQWLADAASLRLTMNQIQKHRIYSAVGFCLCKQGFSRLYVRRCERECAVGKKKKKYVCMQFQCSTSPQIFYFGAEVMYCIEIDIHYFFMPTVQFQMLM